MWPFNKNKEPQPIKGVFADSKISYSQVDITEDLQDQVTLGPEDWIKTIPVQVSNPEEVGLPPKDADSDVRYKLAAALSKMREGLPLLTDGVYCPVCHIANVSLSKLHTPCPQCGRALLQFGWD